MDSNLAEDSIIRDLDHMLQEMGSPVVFLKEKCHITVGLSVKTQLRSMMTFRFRINLSASLGLIHCTCDASPPIVVDMHSPPLFTDHSSCFKCHFP